MSIPKDPSENLPEDVEAHAFRRSVVEDESTETDDVEAHSSRRSVVEDETNEADDVEAHSRR